MVSVRGILDFLALMGADVPAGFEPSERTGPFLDMIGPVCTRAGEHGTLLGLRAPSRPHLLTVSLTVDYVAAAQDGDWLEASATEAATALGPDADRAAGILPADFLHAGTGSHRSAVPDEFSAVPPS